jgi:hypothetical protein
MIDYTTNAVDYWNMYGSWEKSLDLKQITINDDDSFLVTIKNNPDPLEIKPTITGHLILPKNCTYKAPWETPLSKFMLYSLTHHKGNHRAAATYIEVNFLNTEIPYIRVGCDYFKVTQKRDRYGIVRTVLKGWKKDELKQDHGPKITSVVPLFDDFCIEPDNKNHQLIHDNCYNLYAPFNHQPSEKKVSEKNIPNSLQILKHIFGEQFDLGLKYMQALYQLPKQVLPIVCLVSETRNTGKTTFLNWIDMIFSDNYLLINPDELTIQFNANYANKNIIGLDETVIEKSHIIEKLKSLATAKSISVNAKFVQPFSIPFYGKIILCTNKELDFMRIDEEEIRFWIRKVPSIAKGTENTSFLDDLRSEIPDFLKYLDQLPALDVSKSRMVFTPEEIANANLRAVQKESWSNLRKELHMLFEDFFNNNTQKECHASATDIKTRWFERNSSREAHYISKVMKDEMRYASVNSTYVPFDNDPATKKKGRYFIVKRTDYVQDTVEIQAELPIFEEPPF